MADYVSVLTGGSNNFDTTSEHLNALATDILEDGVVGSVGNTAGVAPMTGGLACNAQGTPNMTVAVTAGKCYVTATPSGQSSQRLRANIAAQNATIAANSTGGTRYDWIYVKIDATNAANPAAAGDNVASIVVSRSTSSSTDNGTPPTYGYAIAVVTVANGASSITNGNITDVRESVAVVNNSSDDGWTSLGDTPDTVTYNGNGYYDLVFNSTDHSDTLSNGAKLKLVRTTTAPTQCTDLERSSSQYYSKSSPSGCTFTDDFAVSAWVKLEDYPTSGYMGIIGRDNSNNGWYLIVDSEGQVYLQGVNAGAANYSRVVSYASIPTGRWVHIAAQLDMSSYTATSTTSYIMFDGQNIESFVERAGTNPTALVQAGDLRVGASNSSGLWYWDGKLAQVAVFSAKVTQATMRTYMTQGLSGSETSLVSAYSFNNAITDLNTSNANNLTAQNSAVATDTDSPFAARKINSSLSSITAGTTEYCEVVSISYSTNTTITVRTPWGCAIPTSGGISTVSYSFQSKPYGWPPTSTKILNQAIFAGTQVLANLSGAASADVYGTSLTVTVPEGAVIKISGMLGHQNDTANTVHAMKIQEGTSVLTYVNQVNDSANQEQSIYTDITLTPTAGSHTYKLLAAQSGNTGNFHGTTAGPAMAYFKIEQVV